MDSDNITNRIADLSPAKRALFELRLKQAGPTDFKEQSIPRRAMQAPPPLSSAQQRLWFLSQLEADNPNYNQPKAVCLRGSLDVEALQKALDGVVSRHEVLRTTFASVDGIPVQVIGQGRAVDMPVVDLREWSDGARSAEVQRLLKATIQRPFDLSHDLMLRGILLRLQDNEHILLLVTHHIAGDGMSGNILWKELSALYQVFAAGRPSPLTPLPIQYADYAMWQRDSLQGGVLDAQLVYWKKQLDGAPDRLSFPTDRPRPAVQSFRGAKQAIRLSRELTDGLKKLSQKENATLFMTLLAALQTLLHRYSGQDDIVVGSPIAGRNRVECEKLIGFFVNTLVLRTDVSGNPTFRELLGRVRKVTLGAFAHQDVPFEKLVEELQPNRSLSAPPWFQVMLVFQNDPRETLQLAGITVTPFEVESGTSKYDLLLSVRDEKEGLAGSLEYDTDLFDSTTISGLLARFEILLQGIVADSDKRLSELPFLTELERDRLLVDWNNTKTEFPKDKTIHELFEEQVVKSPDAVAVVFQDRQLTYGEINYRANQLARYLGKLGVKPDTLVGICLERSINMVIAVLGILKAGAAYVPLDPNYPSQRVNFMLQDSRAPVVLAQKQLVSRIQSHSSQVVCLDTARDVIALESGESPEVPCFGESIAYVLYTSGSTGTPKGVVMQHRSLCNLISWQIKNFSFPAAARTLQFASLSFDVSFQEIFSTWCAGGALVIVTEEVRRDPAALLRYLIAESVERLFLPYIALQQLAETAESEEIAPTSLREIITAGEQLRLTSSIRSFLSKLKDCQLRNQYGPTESHVVTEFVLRGSPQDWPGLPPIGRPISNVQIYLLDGHRLPVPIGVPGEIHIGGTGLARAYLNQPELTADKFIGDPFSTEPEARLYKTGDLARYLADGNVEFLGRMDNQVKIRGYRVELGEVESVLNQQAVVRGAVVLARENVSEGRDLVAYVVPQPKVQLRTQELRNLLKRKLPEYMIPAVFVFLDAFPLTPNGKVDANALPPPAQSRRDSGVGFVTPRTLIEQTLAEIWSEVLKVERVDIHDNFFDLGGHSLLGIKLISRLRKEFQIDLPVRSLFEVPTIVGLGTRIEAEREIQIFSRKSETEPWAFLVPLQSGNSGRPVFFLPGGIGGEAEFLTYAKLVRYVGSGYSFYGLRARSADGIKKAHVRVEEMAADYIKEIQTLQPEGPYFLVGECIGGIVAYEIACQLARRGEKVAMLALMDTHCPTRAKYLRYRAGRLIQPIVENYYVGRIGFHWERVQQLARWDKLTYLLTKGSAVLTDGSHLVRQSMPSNGNGNSEAMEQAREVQEGYMETLRRYRPRPYGGRMSLLINENSYQRDPALGWAHRRTARGIEIHKLPGDHTSYIREHVQAAAKQLRECLEKAETKS